MWTFFGTQCSLNYYSNILLSLKYYLAKYECKYMVHLKIRELHVNGNHMHNCYHTICYLPPIILMQQVFNFSISAIFSPIYICLEPYNPSHI